ncbi:predicted transcription regulator, Lrp/AsnC family [Thermococcus kodakarensis KOD1]|uniref:Predicted transcription regulator, Lrp/AsnC family n=1 Tax=Thermococcus kodakarensis (strain ATCC BAA-918 / JCM 12380 / KOD1) TaxID=69014 RepID=Q5JJE1_THEKO|nr:Lrp/AsnC ligand binding domain-containing protein [Thermococcus kodakarensis]WCN27446.1 Lrp/AsnC ligand binding domain-containing protein [Thermococcus kodakarensis]WCN29736.1 Lrp/AsnC ligand binding domain-containing protein [Thermococcus kodakarensis]BAD85676.1 predicted transcription regulator, Lrp/AsnC family [Thermococcus kodakarensis KOD1]
MIEAIVLIVVKPGNEEKVYQEIIKDPRVKEAYRVYGEYDIIIRIEVPSIEELDRFHDEVLRKIKDIELTETLIASSYRR